MHKQSLIWAAKDNEWKKPAEKGAVSILTRESAVRAKSLFAYRFISSRFVVMRNGSEDCKARWCLRGYLDTRCHGTCGQWIHSVSDGVAVWTYALLSDDCERWTFGVPSQRQMLRTENKDHCARVSLPVRSQECQMGRRS